MDLKTARLCLDCEEIFEGESRCPRCDGKAWHPIVGWIKPMQEAERILVRWKDASHLSEPYQRKRLAGVAR
jgi:RNA polymerase subunit RPABC4/transcription elongation factor Spt4